VSVGDAVQDIVFSSPVSGLRTNVTYWYRCYASNSVGTAWASPATWFNSTPASGGGGSGGGGYKMKISFTNYNRAEALTNFPALVVLSNSMAGTTFDFGTFLTTNGYDLRFWNDTETTNLNYEIDSWSTGSSAYVWVQVTNFTNNCCIWAKWGDSSQTNQPVYTTNGATWSAGYVGVWHMKSDAGSGTHRDSVSSNHATEVSDTVTVAGRIGDAQEFDGNSDELLVANESNFDFVNAMSIEVWTKVAAFDTGWQALVAKGEGTVWRLHRFNNANSMNWSANNAFSGSGNVNDGAWHYLSASKSTVSGMQLYLDGRIDGNDPAATGAISTDNNQVRIGENPGAPNREWEGIIDEVRISSVSRSSNWVWACYMNMASNSFFNTPGAIQVLGGSIQNLAPTAITNTSAVLNASFCAATTNYDVYVHWGMTDGTTNSGAWAGSAFAGSFTNVASTNISYTNTSLSAGRTYYYTFRAMNASTNIWATPSWQFSTSGFIVSGSVFRFR